MQEEAGLIAEQEANFWKERKTADSLLNMGAQPESAHKGLHKVAKSPFNWFTAPPPNKRSYSSMNHVSEIPTSPMANF